MSDAAAHTRLLDGLVELLRHERRPLVVARVRVLVEDLHTVSRMTNDKARISCLSASACSMWRWLHARLGERLARVLVQVGHGDASRELHEHTRTRRTGEMVTSCLATRTSGRIRAAHHSVVGVVARHRRRRLGGELIQLARCHALVHARRHLLRHDDLTTWRRAPDAHGACVSARKHGVHRATFARTGSQNSTGRPHERRLMRDVILSNDTASLRPSRLRTYMAASVPAQRSGEEHA